MVSNYETMQTIKWIFGTTFSFAQNVQTYLFFQPTNDQFDMYNSLQFSLHLHSWFKTKKRKDRRQKLKIICKIFIFNIIKTNLKLNISYHYGIEHCAVNITDDSWCGAISIFEVNFFLGRLVKPCIPAQFQKFRFYLHWSTRQTALKCAKISINCCGVWFWCIFIKMRYRLFVAMKLELRNPWESCVHVYHAKCARITMRYQHW